MDSPFNQLIQGDCLTYLQGLEDNAFDLIVTDPPYGLGEWVGKNKSRGKHAKAAEWGVQEWDNQIPDREYFEQMLRVSKNQIIFGGNYFANLLPPSPCWIVWDKMNTGNFADCELAWASFPTAVRQIRYMWNGMNQGKAGGNKKLNEKRVHPTQKPIPVMEWILGKYAKPGDRVLDPFMGSGTTGIACANLKGDRAYSFVGIEKEPEFFTIAKERIERAAAQQSF